MDYIEAIQEANPREGLVRLDADTSMSPGTFEAALRSAGGAVMAVDEVMTGKVSNAFCAMRPPGHHAETAAPMGFCFFNNAAIAARHAQNQYGAERVAVIDFDVHHGNGTQEIFWSDPTVMYCSTHEMPLYPGTGAVSERGEHNNIVNAPLRAGDGGDEFHEAFETRILPRLRGFRPDLVVISAGFDAHLRDPLANLNLPGRRFRLGHAQAPGGRRPKRQRPHRVVARRRLRLARARALGRGPCGGADARLIFRHRRSREAQERTQAPDIPGDRTPNPEPERPKCVRRHRTTDH